MEPATDRSSLRRRYRNARRRLSPAAQWRHSLRISRRFLCSPLTWRASRIAAYLAIDGEVDLEPLLRRLATMGKPLALPVIKRDQTMDFFAYDDTTALVANRYGIREPAPGVPYVRTMALDVVLTPLVAFDDSGNRLGMGGGYYDRHFASLPSGLQPLLIGIAHEVQHAASLPSAPWDLPLDAVLTEAGWHTFSKRPGF